MKISDPGAATTTAAIQGDLAAIDAVLLAIQPGVYNLAVRMLGNREDAADAAQEIMLKVVTHLSSFRGEAAFTTWVFGIARNHLLTARTRVKESPEVSLEGIAERLQAGLDYGSSQGDLAAERLLSPEDKVAARQVALGCTQNMLMALDREQRLVYVLDAVFGLTSGDAAAVLEITPEAYRQRLSRARAKLNDFTGRTCGLVAAAVACRCERQLPAIDHVRKLDPSAPVSLRALSSGELSEAERQFDSLTRMGDAVALFRAHPVYGAPDSLHGAIRTVLRAGGYWPRDKPAQ